VHSDPIDLGSYTADANGEVMVPSFKLPAGFAPGAHEVWLVGAKSGTVKVGFKVTIEADTGGGVASDAGLVPGLLLLVTGLGLVAVRMRRQAI